MVHYKYKCGVSGGRDPVYKHMEGLWNYNISCFICDIYMYVVLAGGVIGVRGEAGWCAALYLLLVVGGVGLVFTQVCLGVCVDVIRWLLICYRPRM